MQSSSQKNNTTNACFMHDNCPVMAIQNHDPIAALNILQMPGRNVETNNN